MPSGRSGRSPRDRELRDRLRPFVGIIRRDLRGRPLVVQPRRPARRRDPVARDRGRALHAALAGRGGRPVRAGAARLSPGPAPDRRRDRRGGRVSSDDILDLKVADIACGSGAFLVAAARYLAARLVEAWHREGAATGTPHDLYMQRDPQGRRQLPLRRRHQRHGRRDVQALALAGLARPELPFSFVDDKVLHGNSLLGLTDLRQLEACTSTRRRPATRQIDARAIFDVDVDASSREPSSLRRRSPARSTTPTRSAPRPRSAGSGASTRR